MTEQEIEAIIEECKTGASEPAFNLDKGHVMVINYQKYADLLEHLIRTHLGEINLNE